MTMKFENGKLSTNDKEHVERFQKSSVTTLDPCLYDNADELPRLHKRAYA